MPDRSSKWIRRSTRLAIYLRDNYTCMRCGAFELEPTLDHIVPRSKGGSHKHTNLITCCRVCNSTRQDRRTPRTRAIKNALRRSITRHRVTARHMVKIGAVFLHTRGDAHTIRFAAGDMIRVTGAKSHRDALDVAHAIKNSGAYYVRYGTRKELYR